MQVIQHNLSAMYGRRQMKLIMDGKTKSTEKLSSGYRINRSADDAAGLAISEKMRLQIRGLDKATQNIQDGISFLQVGEGALGEIHSMLDRIKELSVQAANDTNTDSDRAALDGEIQQIKEEMDRIFHDTEFNTKPVFRAQYIPSISGEPSDFGIYNTGEVSVGGSAKGGVIINKMRLSWEELGLESWSEPVDEDRDFTFYEDITDKFGNAAKEKVTLRVKAGETYNDVHRVYEVTADNVGIKVNDVYAGKWGYDIKETNEAFTFDFGGMDFSIPREPGDSRYDVIEVLGKSALSHVTFDAIPMGEDMDAAVHSTESTMRLYVNNSNKGSAGHNEIENWNYSIIANKNGVGLGVSGNTVSDSASHNFVNWNQFTNTDSGEPSYRITDFGTNDGVDTVNPVTAGGGTGGNQVTLDNDATYRYSTGSGDASLSFEFSFPKDEVSKTEAIVGLSQTLSGSRVVSPVTVNSATSSGNVTVTNSSDVSFHFQRDQLLRDFNGSSNMTATVVRRAEPYGVITDYEERKVLKALYLGYNTTTTMTGTAYYKDANGVEQSAGERTVTRTGTFSENMTGSAPKTTATNNKSDYDLGGGYYFKDYTENINYQFTGIYKDSGHGLTYVASASQIDSLTYYIKDNNVSAEAAKTAERDSDRDFIKTAGATGAGGQRYIADGTVWQEDKTYNRSRYVYEMKNSAGNVIMTGYGDTVIDTSSSGVLDSQADYMHDVNAGISRSGQTVPGDGLTGSTLTYQNSAGVTRSEATNQIKSNRTVTLSGSDVDGKAHSITLKYNDSSAGANSSINVTFNTGGQRAYRDFYKSEKSGGSAVETNFITKMNPPEKILQIQAGALAWQSIDLKWTAMSNSILGVSDLNTLTYSSSQLAIATVDMAIDEISYMRNNFGAQQNRLEHARDIDANTSENTSYAESRIRDTDMAKEMVNYSKHNILEQAALSMLAQTSSSKEGILMLLR